MWVTDLTLQDKNTNLNNFKSDIMFESIEEYQLKLEDTRDGKGELCKLREFSHEKWNQ